VHNTDWSADESPSWWKEVWLFGAQPLTRLSLRLVRLCTAARFRGFISRKPASSFLRRLTTSPSLIRGNSSENVRVFFLRFDPRWRSKHESQSANKQPVSWSRRLVVVSRRRIGFGDTRVVGCPTERECRSLPWWTAADLPTPRYVFKLFRQPKVRSHSVYSLFVQNTGSCSSNTCNDSSIKMTPGQTTFLQFLYVPTCVYRRLQDNSPTNQLAVSQVADWITRGLVNSATANF